MICKAEFSEIPNFVKYAQLSNALSHIIDTLDGIQISSILELENARDSIVSKFEFGGISIFLRLMQQKNANSHIFNTFDGRKISSMLELANANFSIACKFEFGGISTLFRFRQSWNASYDDMILILDGITISLMSRRANKRVSNTLLFGLLFPNKYLSSLNMNWSFNGEILIFIKLLVKLHHPSFNSLKLAGKEISKILDFLNESFSIVCNFEFAEISTFVMFWQFSNAYDDMIFVIPSKSNSILELENACEIFL